MEQKSLNEKKRKIQEQKKGQMDVISPRQDKNSQLISPKHSRNAYQKSNHTQLIQKRCSRIQSSQPFKQLEKFKLSSQVKFLNIILKKHINQKFLAQSFESIRNSIKIHKISLGLLNKKHKRNLTYAFLAIKQHYIHLRKLNIFQKLQQLKPASFVCFFLLRLQRKFIKQFLSKIKIYSARKVKVIQVTKKLHGIIDNSIEKWSVKIGFQKLKLKNFKNDLEQKYLQKMTMIFNKGAKKSLNLGFSKIINFVFVKDFQRAIQERKQLNRDIITVSSSRKSAIIEEKQQLKKMKLAYESLNLEKNRSFNELKRSRINLKQHMSIDIRQMQKQQSELWETLQLQKNKLKIKEARKSEALNGDYLLKVNKLYREISIQQEQEIAIPQTIVLKQLIQRHQMDNFEGSSVEYYLSQNQRLLKLMQVYQGSGEQVDQQGQVQYLEAKKENLGLKKMLSLLFEKHVSRNLTSSCQSFYTKTINQSLGPPSSTGQNLFSIQSLGQENYQPQKISRDELPISSKKSSNTSSVARITGKITSRATYFNV